MEFLLLVSIFFAITRFQSTIADDVYCSFVTLNDQYTCQMTNEIKSRDNNVNTLIRGNHSTQSNSKILKSNVDVEVFSAITKTTLTTQSSTQYLPINVCKTFTSLSSFDVSAKFLKELSRNNFLLCASVERLRIVNSEVSWLPEDVFQDLVKLNDLIMTNNKLELLPKNLFSRNQLLQSIDLSSNKFTTLRTVLPETITNVQLGNSFCINQNRNQIHNIELILSANQRDCKFSGIAKTQHENDELKQVVEQTRLKLTNLTDKLASLTNDTENLVISQRQENQRLIHENDELKRNVIQMELKLTNLTRKLALSINETECRKNERKIGDHRSAGDKYFIIACIVLPTVFFSVAMIIFAFTRFY